MVFRIFEIINFCIEIVYMLREALIQIQVKLIYFSDISLYIL